MRCANCLQHEAQVNCIFVAAFNCLSNFSVKHKRGHHTESETTSLLLFFSTVRGRERERARGRHLLFWAVKKIWCKLKRAAWLTLHAFLLPLPPPFPHHPLQHTYLVSSAIYFYKQCCCCCCCCSIHITVTVTNTLLSPSPTRHTSHHTCSHSLSRALSLNLCVAYE